MTKKQRMAEVISVLKKTTRSDCALDFKGDAWKLAVMARLSAQCKDATVNMVTPELFREFPDVESMAKAEVSEIERIIKICGLYKTKAQSLVGIAKKLLEDFGGNVPDTIEELTRLPGVGRKTANLICGDIYGKPAVVTDTHFIRLCNRLGLVKTTDPIKVENEMRGLLPPSESNDFCHRSVLHGRAVCTAKKAFCETCCLASICEKNIKKNMKGVSKL